MQQNDIHMHHMKPNLFHIESTEQNLELTTRRMVSNMTKLSIYSKSDKRSYRNKQIYLSYKGGLESGMREESN